LSALNRSPATMQIASRSAEELGNRTVAQEPKRGLSLDTGRMAS
jgi:hypothetical protein